MIAKLNGPLTAAHRLAIAPALLREGEVEPDPDAGSAARELERVLPG